MRFGVLGPFEVRDETGAALTITRRKPRLLLALLLFRTNAVVPTTVLIAQLWGERPPVSVAANLQSYVAGLRRVLDTPDRLETRPGGYLLRVDDGELDSDQFAKLATRATAELAAGAAASAAEHLSAALELWRGPVLDGLEPPELLRADVERLDELRVRVIEDRARAWLDLGRHDGAIAELRALTGQYPLRERPWELLMLALYRDGRTDDALTAYQGVRQILDEHLGVEPGPAVRRMQHAILTADPAIDPPPELRRAAWVRPRQLPPDITTLVGRAPSMSALDDLLGACRATHPLIAMLVGPAGVGKTTLAVHWAHRAAPHFPDGQLFADLRGYSTVPALRQVEVLTRFLHALGVRPGQVPTDLADAAALYRSVLADRRVLVVLDNVAAPDQVRALLPGSPSSAVLITSRDRLTGLTATLDTDQLELAELSAADSLALLARIVGADRVAAAGDAARELVRLCAGLPLALRIVAANLVLWPDQPIAGYLAELAGADLLAKLNVPGDEHLGVRQAFDLSYDAVSPAAARLFCLFGLVPGPEVCARGAAALAGVKAAQAGQLLRELAASHLVQPRGAERFGMHDLLRGYAATRANEELAAPDKHEALRRLFALYLRTAGRAATVLYPDLQRLPDTTVAAEPEEVIEPAQARHWLLTEQANLLAAMRWTAEHGPLPYAWWLADVLRGFFHSHRLDAEWQAAATIGLSAARQASDHEAIGAMRHSLGALAWSRGDYRLALTELEEAQASYRAAGARGGAGSVLHALGVVYLDLGRLDRAIEHFTAAFAAAEDRSTPIQAANWLINLGAAVIEHGRLADGMRYNERALSICRRHGSRHAAATALCNLGYSYRVTGDLERALTVLTEALDTWRELGARDDEADTLVRMAAVHRVAGRVEVARGCAHEAIKIVRDAGNQRFETDARCALADVYRQHGAVETAHSCYAEALRLAEKIGYRRGEIEAMTGLAAVSEPVAAIEHATTAARDADDGGFRLLADHARIRLAEASLAAGGQVAAEEYATRAVRGLRAAGHRLGEAHGLVALGRVRLRTTGQEAAERCWHAAEDLLAGTGAGPALAEVRALLAPPNAVRA